MNLNRNAVKARTHAKGVQLSNEAVREMDKFNAEVFDEAAAATVARGARRVSAAAVQAARSKVMKRGVAGND